MKKFLIIQTAFTGDVVLATAVAEKLHQFFPDSPINLLVRKGNEDLLKEHPFINNVIIRDKTKDKNKNLLKIILKVRKERYTHVINLHRFSSSGMITMMSGAPHKIGFDKNPFSIFYTKRVRHIISEPYTANPVHEIDRNQMLIASLTDEKAAMPRLYPSEADYSEVKKYQEVPYVCIAPSSVWFTKQLPKDKWTDLVSALDRGLTIYLLGGPSDKEFASEILRTIRFHRAENVCGKLSYLQSAALMERAVMNYVNDSAPLHFASAMNAPVTAIYCSTVPSFGFGPVRENGRIAEIEGKLYCRPCGLHGYMECPEGHFRCAHEIDTDKLAK